MEMSLQRQQEGRHVGISSSLARLHTDAKHVVPMIRACFAVVAMIPPTIPDIWFMSVSLPAIAVAVTVEIRKHGGFLYTAQFIQHTQMALGVMKRERHHCPLTWLRVFE